MDQPLWQTLFNVAMIGFVARRAALGLALHAERTSPVLWGVYVALLIVCALAGIAILLGRRWVMAGLIGLVLAFGVSTFVELAIGGVAPAGWLLLQLLIALGGSAVLLVWAHRSAGEARSG